MRAASRSRSAASHAARRASRSAATASRVARNVSASRVAASRAARAASRSREAASAAERAASRALRADITLGGRRLVRGAEPVALANRGIALAEGDITGGTCCIALLARPVALAA